MNLKKSLMGFILLLFLPVNICYATVFINSPPLSKVIKTDVRPVKKGPYTQVPLITWGGDLATILANGGSKITGEKSLFHEINLRLHLVREDNFKRQVESYLEGKTPYLRGTMGMINMASEVLSKDPRTKPVIIYQMTWSNGGDCIVVKSGIHTARDLKGKTIALQAYGPHVDYLAKILKDAGLSMKDVRIKWMRDLTGTAQSPGEAFHDQDIHAAFVIIPDGLMLTSNGTSGTGAEGSVKGARIMLSTRTANRIISDVYAVRSDYFESNKEEVRKFVHGLLLAGQNLKDLFNNRASRVGEFKNLLRSSAEILLDSAQATGDAEALYGDCELTGFPGNVKFFGDENWPRNMDRITGEIQSAFITAGLIGKKTPLSHARWNYDDFRQGLVGVDAVEAPRFRKDALAKMVAKKQAMGTLSEGELFSFDINFRPNQKFFSTDLYNAEFTRVVELASTYGGAVIVVEGHSDPQKYNKIKTKGGSKLILNRTKQAAKNLSMSRAIAVRNSIIEYAVQNGVPLDESQFTVVGHGLLHPRYPKPKTKEQWLSNMRVVFRIIQIEAEESVFEPI